MKKINIKTNLDKSDFIRQINDLIKNKYKINVDVNDNGGANKAAQNMKQLEKNTSAAKTSFAKLRDTLSNTFSSGRLGFAACLTMMNEVNKAAGNFNQTIKDMDKCITDLSVAMRGSRSEAQDYLQLLNKQARDLSVTTKITAETSNTFLRTGKSIKETNELIKDATVLSKIGQVNADAAAKDLLSTLNGYKMAAKDAMDIVDKLSAVDAISASSSGSLAESISKVASTADMAGVSLDKLIGYVATIKDTSPQMGDSEIGNAMKAVLARINNIKVGKFIDDETGESLNDTEKLLSALGISMRDMNNQFLKSEEILDTLGQRWDTFDSNTQRALGTTLAGTYRLNSFISLMDNYDKALQYTEASLNSTGSAMDKFNNSYKNSLEAKESNLQAAFERLTIDSDFDQVYASIIDATTALVEFLDKTNALKGVAAGFATGALLKGLVAVKTGFGEAFIALNQFNNALKISKQTEISTDSFDRLLILSKNLSESQTRLILSSRALTNEQREQILINQGLSSEEAKLKLQSLSLANAQTGLTATTTSLGNALKGLFAYMIQNPIFLISTTISAATMAWTSYNQKIEETRQKTKQAAEEAMELSDEIIELSSKYLSLSEAVKSDISVKDELLSTQKELLEKFGLESENLDDLINKYGSLDEVVKKTSIDLLKNAEIDLVAGIGAAEDELLSINKKHKNLLSSGGKESVKAYEVLEKAGIISKGSYGTGGGSIVLTGEDTVEGVLQNYQQLQDALNALIESDRFTEDELSNNPVFQQLYNRANEMKEIVENYNSLINEFNENKAHQFVFQSLEGKQLPNSQKEFNDYKQELIESAVESKKFKGSQEEIEDVILSVLSTMSGFEQYFDHFSSTENSIIKNTENVKTTFSQAWEALANTDNESLKNANKDLLSLAEAGQLTVEALREIGAEDHFKKFGISAERAIDKINDLVTASDQLSSMQSGITSISDVLYEKKQNLGEKETANLGIAPDTLAGFDATIKGLDTWETFERTLSNGKSSMEDCKKAANALATEWVNSNNFLAQLDETNKDYYISSLKNMGVENAEAVVTKALSSIILDEKAALEEVNAISKKSNGEKEISIKKTKDLDDATISEIGSLITYGDKLGVATGELQKLMNKKIMAATYNAISNNDFTSIVKYCKYLGIAIAELEALQAAKENRKAVTNNIHANDNNSTSLHYEQSTKKSLNTAKKNVVKAAQAELKTLFAEVDNVSVGETPDQTAKDKKEKSKSKASKFKEEIDWTAQAITTLQQKIDELNTKLQNKEGYDAQHEILQQLISDQEELAKAYKKQADTYKNEYKSSIQGLSKSDINKIENGAYTIETFKGKAKSGKKSGAEKRYDKLQNAIEAYNNYQDALSNVKSTKQEAKSTKIQDKENYSSKLSTQADTKSNQLDDVTSYKQKKKLIQEIADLNLKDLDTQIEIAKLQGDKTAINNLKQQKKDILAQEQEDLRQTEIDRYESKLSDLQNKEQIIKDKQAINEDKGKAVTASYYKDLIKNAEKQDEWYQSELKFWQEQQKSVKEGTLQWNEYQEQIDSVIQAQNENTLELLEYKDALENLPIERLNTQLENLQTIRNNLENANELKEAQGNYLTENDYAVLIANSEEQIAKYQEQNNLLRTQLVGLDEESDKYKELVSQINSNVDAIHEETMAQEEYNDSIETLNLDKLERELELRQNIAGYVKSAISAKEASGKSLTENDYLTQIADINRQAETVRGMMADYKAKMNEALAEGKGADYTEAMNNYLSQKQALADLEAEYYETVDKLQTINIDRHDKEIERLQAEKSLEQSLLELREKQGRTFTENDYAYTLDNLRKQLSEQEAKKEEYYALYLEEKESGNDESARQHLISFKETLAELNSLYGELEEVYDKLITAYMEPFVKAYDAAKRYKDVINEINGMIPDDYMFDADGNLTDMGSAKIGMIAKQYLASIEEAKKAEAELEKMNSLYAAGTSGLSKDEYEAKRDEYLDQIVSASQEAQNALKTVSDTIIKQYQNELEALKKVIDARVEALRRKKEYYDYDKTIRKQTKDIQSLEAQKAAIEATSDSTEKRKKLLELQEQLNEANDALEETRRDHEVELQTKGLEDLYDILAEKLDLLISDIQTNFQTQIGLMTDILNNMPNLELAIYKSYQDISNAFGLNSANIIDAINKKNFFSTTDSSSSGSSNNGYGNSSTGSSTGSNVSYTDNNSSQTGVISAVHTDPTNGSLIGSNPSNVSGGMQKIAEEAKYRGYSDQAILASMQAAMQGASWDAALQKGADIDGIDLSSPWTLPYVGSLWNEWANEQVKNKDLTNSSVLSGILKTMNEAVNKAVESGYYHPSEDSEINKAINNLQQKYTEALKKEAAAQATKPQNTTSYNPPSTSSGSSSSSSGSSSGTSYTPNGNTTGVIGTGTYHGSDYTVWVPDYSKFTSSGSSSSSSSSVTKQVESTMSKVDWDAVKEAQQSHSGSNKNNSSSSSSSSSNNTFTPTGNKTGVVGTQTYNGSTMTVWVPDYSKLNASVANSSSGSSSSKNNKNNSNSKNKKNKYAEGGVVGGNSFEGDKLLALVNSGESVLTREFTSILPKTVDTMNIFNRLKLATPDYSFLDKLAIRDSSPTVNISYDNMINIEGNATDDTVQTIKKMMPQITNDITKSLVKDLKKNGFK